MIRFIIALSLVSLLGCNQEEKDASVRDSGTDAETLDAVAFADSHVNYCSEGEAALEFELSDGRNIRECLSIEAEFITYGCQRMRYFVNSSEGWKDGCVRELGACRAGRISFSSSYRVNWPAQSELLEMGVSFRTDRETGCESDAGRCLYQPYWGREGGGLNGSLCEFRVSFPRPWSRNITISLSRPCLFYLINPITGMPEVTPESPPTLNVSRFEYHGPLQWIGEPGSQVHDRDVGTFYFPDCGDAF